MKAIGLVLTLASGLTVMWLFDLGSRFTGPQLFVMMIPAGALFAAFWGWILER